MARRFVIAPKLRPLVDAAGAALDSIKLNGISVGRRYGRHLRVKRRRVGSEAIAGTANLFFKMADAHISVCADPKAWQHWEILCYRLLNGKRFRVFTCGARTVCQEKLPGVSLRRLLERENLRRKAIEAAAKEIRRAHQLKCRELGGGWSHADLHMGNVIYDKKADRARLIDFEIIHDKSWPTTTRQADDLLTFLLDMAGLVPPRQWLPLALCFLDIYGRPRVIAELRKLLVVPSGAVRGLWWAIRSDYCDRDRLRRHIKALRETLDARATGKARKPRLQKAACPCAPARVGRAK